MRPFTPSGKNPPGDGYEAFVHDFASRLDGLGYATEGASAALDQAFGTLGLDTVCSLPQTANPRSMRRPTAASTNPNSPPATLPQMVADAKALKASGSGMGLVLDPGAAILGFLPAAGANEALNLILGLLGLLAAAGSPRRQAAPRKRSVSASRATPERTSPLL